MNRHASTCSNCTVSLLSFSFDASWPWHASSCPPPPKRQRRVIIGLLDGGTNGSMHNWIDIWHGIRYWRARERIKQDDKAAKHWKHLNTLSALSAATMHFLWTTRLIFIVWNEQWLIPVMQREGKKNKTDEKFCVANKIVLPLWKDRDLFGWKKLYIYMTCNFLR